MKLNPKLAQGPQQVYGQVASSFNVGLLPGAECRIGILSTFPNGHRTILSLDRQDAFHLMSALCALLVHYSEELQAEPEEPC